MFRKLSLSLLLALVVWLGISLGPGTPAAQASCITITVTPSNPTEVDAIEITVAGVLPDPCFDITSSHTVDGTFIDVTVQATPWEGVCVLVMSDFSATEAIGQLPAGEYLVQPTVYIAGDPSPCVESTTFQVQPSAPDSDNDSFDGVTILSQTPGAAASTCPAGAVPMWADCVESYLGTDALDNCSADTIANNEPVDALPPDLNDDRTVNVLDVFSMFPFWLGPGVRQDLNADGSVNILDVFKTFPVWLHTCT